MAQANCIDYPDPDAFFPGPGQTARAQRAKKVCSTCPVTEQCWNHKKVTGSTDGIWGGRSNRRKKGE
ncbi:transcriptional regulator WhiB-like [Gordonia phage Demosthenes]|uniref:WhiB family transcription factor n=6 Tax=Demosthenesvirus TaxID=1982106 RepID=A0A345MCH1_9CAUD|nr:transcriptional regulator WhiB-like [Gordonia phage Demosthenes]YP_009603313.1 transcriptional regulator WhiB-like [Gordonia phage Katyusha]AMS03749.1 WhiB family transcription factor [Gordonia phage Benczkowski14]AXH68192.1 WhiB family transcription factor [Gordonia phage Teatealatte]QBP29598.1 WhiB family transcription factor [Gordonia phage Tredge]QFG08527.1 WhiB family transcription factor [Gordonia phage ASerpRocky]UJD20677.1 WhiB family transcription factor [Gordonia phage Niagara]U